jgi:hypothetical protein
MYVKRGGVRVRLRMTDGGRKLKAFAHGVCSWVRKEWVVKKTARRAEA